MGTPLVPRPPPAPYRAPAAALSDYCPALRLSEYLLRLKLETITHVCDSPKTHPEARNVLAALPSHESLDEVTEENDHGDIISVKLCLGRGSDGAVYAHIDGTLEFIQSNRKGMGHSSAEFHPNNPLTWGQTSARSIGYIRASSPAKLFPAPHILLRAYLLVKNSLKTSGFVEDNCFITLPQKLPQALRVLAMSSDGKDALGKYKAQEEKYDNKGKFLFFADEVDTLTISKLPIFTTPTSLWLLRRKIGSLTLTVLPNLRMMEFDTYSYDQGDPELMLRVGRRVDSRGRPVDSRGRRADPKGRRVTLYAYIDASKEGPMEVYLLRSDHAVAIELEDFYENPEYFRLDDLFNTCLDKYQLSAIVKYYMLLAAEAGIRDAVGIGTAYNPEFEDSLRRVCSLWESTNARHGRHGTNLPQPAISCAVSGSSTNTRAANEKRISQTANVSAEQVITIASRVSVEPIRHIARNSTGQVIPGNEPIVTLQPPPTDQNLDGGSGEQRCAANSDHNMQGNDEVSDGHPSAGLHDLIEKTDTANHTTCVPAPGASISTVSTHPNIAGAQQFPTPDPMESGFSMKPARQNSQVQDVTLSAENTSSNMESPDEIVDIDDPMDFDNISESPNGTDTEIIAQRTRRSQSPEPSSIHEAATTEEDSELQSKKPQTRADNLETLQALRSHVGLYGQESLAVLPGLDQVNLERCSSGGRASFRLYIGVYAADHPQNAGIEIWAYLMEHICSCTIAFRNVSKDISGQEETTEAFFDGFNPCSEKGTFLPADIFKGDRVENEVKAIFKYYCLLAVELRRDNLEKVQIPDNQSFRTMLKKACTPESYRITGPAGSNAEGNRSLEGLYRTERALSERASHPHDTSLMSGPDVMQTDEEHSDDEEIDAIYAGGYEANVYFSHDDDSDEYQPSSSDLDQDDLMDVDEIGDDDNADDLPIFGDSLGRHGLGISNDNPARTSVPGRSIARPKKRPLRPRRIGPNKAPRLSSNQSAPSHRRADTIPNERSTNRIRQDQEQQNEIHLRLTRGQAERVMGLLSRDMSDDHLRRCLQDALGNS